MNLNDYVLLVAGISAYAAIVLFLSNTLK